LTKGMYSIESNNLSWSSAIMYTKFGKEFVGGGVKEKAEEEGFNPYEHSMRTTTMTIRGKDPLMQNILFGRRRKEEEKIS
jgi:hypothetical protein